MTNKYYYRQPTSVLADKDYNRCVKYANFISGFFQRHDINNWELAGIKARFPIDEKFCQSEDAGYCKYCGKLETTDEDAISCCGHRSIDLLQERKANRKASGDKINPDHYKIGGIETFDILRAKLSPTQLAGFCKGNVIKYITRADHKDKVDDLKKCRWYLDKLIEELDGKATS